MNKFPLHSIRIGGDMWSDINKLDTVLSLLKKYPSRIEQVTLFTAFTHQPLTLAEAAERAEVMKERMEYIRAHGFGAGINILATVGHHSEDASNSLDGGYTLITNIHGQTERGCFCFNSESYVNNHLVPMYTVFAKSNPDYIWIDDDVRFGHGRTGNGCFCDSCIASFNAQNGTAYTREELRERFDSGDIELRRRYLAFNTSVLSHLLEVLGNTVRAVNPDITMGFMTGERYFEGFAFDEFARALSSDGKYPIMWRPGGGAYDDHSVEDFIDKAFQIGCQTAYLPPYVSVIHSEIENFPYQFIKKSPRSTATEVALYMTTGCTGAAFNMLPIEGGESPIHAEGHFRAYASLLPFYELINEKLRGLRPVGIHTGWRPDSMAATPSGCDWTRTYGGMYAGYARETFFFGLPVCFRPDCASVTTLCGNAVAVMSDKEVLALLKSGLHVDGEALDALNKRGFGRYTGFKLIGAVDTDAHETYTDDPINEGFVGNGRNGRQMFYPDSSFAIEPTHSHSRIIGKLTDYRGNTLASCCAGLFENELGGRIYVAGYYPYTQICDYSKTVQLKRIFTYLSHGTLPSYVESYAHVRNVTHSDGKRTVVTVFNPNTQELDGLRLAVHTEKTSAVCYTPDGKAIALSGEPDGEGYVIFTLPCMSVLDIFLVEIK